MKNQRFIARVALRGGTLTTSILAVTLCHQGDTTTYITRPGHHGWVRCTEPLYETEADARRALVDMLRQVSADAHAIQYRIAREADYANR